MKLLDVVGRVLGEPHHAGHLLARQQVEQLEVATGGAGQLAGVARARPVAAELGLEEDDVLAALGEPQRGRHAVDAAADDGDLAGEVPVERRAGCPRVGRPTR